MSAFRHIPEQMADNAAFLWILHNKALSRSDYTLEELETLEMRITAQLNGLLCYGDEAWDIAFKAVSRYPAEGEIFTAATLAFVANDAEKIQQVLNPQWLSVQHYNAWLSAFSWQAFNQIQGCLSRFLQSSNPLQISLGIAACALHRRDCGQLLISALDNQEMIDNPIYLARLIRAIGELHRTDLLSRVQVYQSHDNTDVAFWACWSSVMLGDKQGLLGLKAYVLEDHVYSERALNLLLRALPQNSAKAVIQDVAKTPARRNLIKGLGIMGDSASLPWLLREMDQPEMARLAGDAFSLMTGLDLSQGEYYLDDDELPDALDTSDDLTDHHLPYPDKAVIERWYQYHKPQFVKGQRFLAGQAISPHTCKHLARHGKQLQRQAAINELLLGQPQRPVGSGVLESPQRVCLAY